MKEQLVQLYGRLQSLNQHTLLTIIDELSLMDSIPNNKYKNMAIDVYDRAKDGYKLSDKQKRVLVNIIGHPREET